MSDDSLDEMPEFDKPENIPVVIVPDAKPLKPEKPKCIEKNKAGGPCKVPPLRGELRCLGHSKSLAPELRDKWRRLGKGIPRKTLDIRKKVTHYTRDELLSFLSTRLDLVRKRFGDMCNVEVEEMICNIVRTMTVVYKIEVDVADGKPLTPALEYEIKEPDARATA